MEAELLYVKPLMEWIKSNYGKCRVMFLAFEGDEQKFKTEILYKASKDLIFTKVPEEIIESMMRGFVNLEEVKKLRDKELEEAVNKVEITLSKLCVVIAKPKEVHD